MTEAERLLDDLDPEQRLAATTLLGPVCVLAGAGTGKTTTITRRLAYGVATGVYAPERSLALTFTTKAAGELRSRLRALGADGVAARTFHSAALAQLGYFWPRLLGGTAPRVLGAKAQLLADAAASLRIRVDQAALRDAASEIEWRKVSGLSIAEYGRRAPSRDLPAALDAERMTRLQERYEELKDERRRIDFEDVLLATAGMLESEPAVAAEVRERYRFITVDEYQDVSPLQQRLLELWLGERHELCVVGDASQTIFSFAGASAEFLLGFGASYPEATIVRLERNHRSAEPILALANRLMRQRPGALELRPALPGGGASPVLSEYNDDAAEAAGVTAAVAHELATGTPPEEIAVLFRLNSQAVLLETALADRGIPVRVLGQGRYFEHPAVQRAMLELRSLALSATDADRPLFQLVSDVLRAAGWSVEPPTGQAERERWSMLGALGDLAERAAPGTTALQFADELFARQQAGHEPTLAAVTLATLHSAKGLEWSSVHLVGLAEGLLPLSHAVSAGLEAIDEERRLCYVGITRAGRRLRLSWARGANRRPSRFLDELRIDSADAAAPPRPSRAR